MNKALSVVAEILESYTDHGNLTQIPYTFTDTVVHMGTPLTRIEGLHKIRARFRQPQAKLISGIGGGGTFVSNRNTSGEIELDVLQGSLSVGFIELFAASGVSLPIIISDIGSGGTSGVIGTGCQLLETAEFEREGEAGFLRFLFGADRMAMFHGIRLPLIP